MVFQSYDNMKPAYKIKTEIIMPQILCKHSWENIKVIKEYTANQLNID